MKTLIGLFFLILFTCFILLSGCDYRFKTNTNHKNNHTLQFKPTPVSLKVPTYFPDFLIPADNPLTLEKIDLGKKLFFETMLSKNNQVSCASCHHPTKAFTDGLPIAKGINNLKGIRNAISLSNLVLKNNFFHDGGVRTLELQALVPFNTAEEFDLDLPSAVERLSADSNYVYLFKKAYNAPPFVKGVTNALASFQRTFISANSKFDMFFYQNDSTIFNKDELEGFKLFFGKANCGKCHNGFLLSDQHYYNIGLQINEHFDTGLRRITGNISDIGKFKTPSLRNIALTAPYMHNGSFADLYQVINFFNKGGYSTINKTDTIKPLNLSNREMEQLIIFLNTLTDTAYCSDSGVKFIETEFTQ